MYGKQFIGVIFIIIMVCPLTGLCLEVMEDNEMASVVGQSGVDITLPGFEFTVYFDSFAIKDDDNGGHLVVSNRTAGERLQATFAQYLLGSRNDIAFDDGVFYKDIDDYVDASYSQYPNNYEPVFKPLTLDIARRNSDRYIRLGLPSMQLIAKDLSNMSLRLGSSGIPNVGDLPLLTLNLPGMVFEGHGGYLNLFPHTNGGFDVEFDQAEFFWYNRKLIIGDSSWDGVSENHKFELNKFLVHRGKNDYRPFILDGKLSVDISTDSSNKTWLNLYTSDYVDDNNYALKDSKLFFTLGQMKANGYDFGKWETGPVYVHDLKLSLSGHNSGIDAKLSLKLYSEELKYTYGSGAGDYNNAEGLCIANSFSWTESDPGASTDPNNPSYHRYDYYTDKWKFGGTLNLGGPVFIKDYDSTDDGGSTGAGGDENRNEPLQLNIYPDRIEATTTIDGSIGVKKVFLGGQNFGPVLVSGIHGWAKITLKK